MEKSHVSMEQGACVVCGATYDTGAILLDRRLRASMEPKTVTRLGMCADHEDLKRQGYVALVGIDPKKSTIRTDTVKPGEAYRTGDVAHVRATAWPNIFNTPVPEGMVAFVEPEVIEKIKELRGAQD